MTAWGRYKEEMKEIIKKVRFLMSISINAFGESVKTKLTIFLRKQKIRKKFRIFCGMY